jgi:release factor glutamine methyltransferase
MSSADQSSFADHSLRLAKLSLIRRLIGRLLRLGFWLTGRSRYDEFRLERVLEARFVVIPGVFNPKLMRTGAFLAAQLDTRVLPQHGEVLDMGTGSGVCAVIASRLAQHVVAVDISLAAVRCAGINARLNQREHCIDVRHGDLFAPVAGERFDLILFNPPFVRGHARDDRDGAWRSSDVAERFAAGLSAHLKPGGCALVVLSSYGDGIMFLEQFRQHQLQVSIQAERRFINERLTVFRVETPGRAP